MYIYLKCLQLYERNKQMKNEFAFSTIGTQFVKTQQNLEDIFYNDSFACNLLKKSLSHLKQKTSFKIFYFVAKMADIEKVKIDLRDFFLQFSVKKVRRLHVVSSKSVHCNWRHHGRQFEKRDFEINVFEILCLYVLSKEIARKKWLFMTK